MVNIDLNKSWIISNSGELSDLEHLLTKTEYMKYFQIADTRTSCLFGPIKQHYLDLNKPLIMRNGGELSDLEYLPMKTEYTKYLQNAATHPSSLWALYMTQ